MSTILIVDDDESVGRSLAKALSKAGYMVRTCEAGLSALDELKAGGVNLMLLDNKLPGMSGLDVLTRMRALHIKVPTVVMTAFGTEETAIEAMKLGAFDYVVKPFDLDELEHIIEKGLEAGRIMAEPISLEARSDVDARAERIIGNSRKMRDIYKLIGQVAQTDVSVLLRGESGTGKELIARFIYQHSRRKEKVFLAVNCAALPETLLESELFGYERGAFTGAVKRRIGKFEQCHQGTIFLDEIGDMSLTTQAKVLRVLQDGRFTRLGGEDTLSVDVRVIAATNKPLEDLMRGGQFRGDLYYRLETVTITIPPLRQRREDIPSIAEYFLNRFVRHFDSPVRAISPPAMRKLVEHAWPGNVRELANIVQRALVLAKGELLGEEHISFGGVEEEPRQCEKEAAWEHRIEECLTAFLRGVPPAGPADLYTEVMGKVEKVLIGYALKESGGNQVQGARILGISRNTLRERMRRYGFGD